MLPGEIAPFADHHIEKLQLMFNALHTAHTLGNSTTFTAEETEELCKTVEGAARALNRFKICMDDEVKQKDRYRNYAKENGYPYT